MQRRQFLKIAGLGSCVLLAPEVAMSAPRARRVLVLVELKGGNDGLNTVIPFADARYATLRPTLAIPADQVLRLDDAVGLHPALTQMRAGWDTGDVAIVQGVGYDDPNRSHFRSIEIWETASDADEVLQRGWLSGAMATDSSDISGITIGEHDAGPMRGGARALMVRRPEQLLRAAKRLPHHAETTRADTPALAHILRTQREVSRATDTLEKQLATQPELGVAFPNHALGQQMEIAARLIVSDVPAMVIRVTHGSFDTHANQKGRHRTLLAQLDEALAALRTSLITHGRWDHAMVMTYSEFGRRAAQNGSGGTDHGTAAPHIVMGGKIKGGLYGKHPSLKDLAGGDLIHHVDFRSLYRTASERWLGLPSAKLTKHPLLGFV